MAELIRPADPARLVENQELTNPIKIDKQFSTSAEIGIVLKALGSRSLTPSEVLTLELRRLILTEWLHTFAKLPPLSEAFSPEFRNEHGVAQKGAWIFRKFLEPGGSSHAGVPEHAIALMRESRQIPEPPPLTHVPRYQVIISALMGDLILDYLRFSGRERLREFFAFGERVFQVEVMERVQHSGTPIDQGELHDPFSGFLLSNGEQVRMAPTIHEYLAFCHHASWRYAMAQARTVGKALQESHGLQGFEPPKRGADEAFIWGQRNESWNRDGVNVLCLSILYAVAPHLRERILEATL